MGLLLQIIGFGWAALGAGNIFMSPTLESGSEAGLVFLLMFNFLLFILPGLAVHGIGVSISKKKSKQRDERTMTCPYCAETIKAEAKICRFCNKELHPQTE